MCDTTWLKSSAKCERCARTRVHRGVRLRGTLVGAAACGLVDCCSQAAAKGADLVHFSECCLSGYAGVEFDSFEGFDWSTLIQGTLEIQQLARELAVWVAVGSSHRLTGPEKPHNCMYTIDDSGALVDRYDKLFAVGSTSEDDSDLAHYSPGSQFSAFEVKGVRCGVLICHDFRYGELYREYLRRGVQLMLHSYHNGHSKTDVVGAGCTPSVREYPDRNSYGGECSFRLRGCCSNQCVLGK